MRRVSLKTLTERVGRTSLGSGAIGRRDSNTDRAELIEYIGNEPESTYKATGMSVERSASR
jgi:hypothetical protein